MEQLRHLKMIWEYDYSRFISRVNSGLVAKETKSHAIESNSITNVTSINPIIYFTFLLFIF